MLKSAKSAVSKEELVRVFNVRHYKDHYWIDKDNIHIYMEVT